ncbi:MAG: hypothetical protein ACI4V7_12275 [Succinivibrionaceae bacterium]
MIECSILWDLLVKECNYSCITITIPEENKTRISITKPYHKFTPSVIVNRVANTIVNTFKQEGINVIKTNLSTDFHEYVVDADINFLIGLIKVKGVCS